MKLETENTGAREIHSASEITDAFSNPKKMGAFVILAKQPEEYLQAAIEGDDCILEYRDGNSDRHFQTVDSVALSEVEAAFLDYFDGGDEWKQAHEWARLGEDFQPLPEGESEQVQEPARPGCSKSAVVLFVALGLLALASAHVLAATHALPNAHARMESQDAATQSTEVAEPASPTVPTAEEISTALQNVIGKNKKFYGLIAGVAVQGNPSIVGAVGTRKKDSGVAIQSGDKMHLGSCTKAMTSTVAAMLIEEGLLSWDSTLAELLPEVEVHADFQAVTFHQLVTHCSGLRRDPRNVNFSGHDEMPDDTARRKHVVEEALAAAPEYEPGSQSSYSNLGIITAGYILEVKTGKPWQTLMRERLFQPLGMDSVGFGPTATGDNTDQPWGHTKSFFFGINPKRDDIPSYYGPAGTVHVSLEDWTKFAQLHMGLQPEGRDLLTPESLEFLHTPRGEEGYACGWVVTERGWGSGTVLTHGGANGRSRSVIWIAPPRKMVFMAATNSSDGDLCNAAIVELLKLCELLPAGE